MNFKPNLWKVIVSILLIIILIFLENYGLMCSICPYGVHRGGGYASLMLVRSCICADISFKMMIQSNFINGVIPFVGSYIIFSLFEKKKINLKKRKK